MRISDWSSDVCSSDLLEAALHADLRSVNATLDEHERIARCIIVDDAWTPDNGLLTPTGKIRRSVLEQHYATDRKSVVSGKSVAVRVDLGGRRIIKKKNIRYIT